MRFAVRGAGQDLLFVLGRGNEPGDEHVDWLLDRLVDRGFRVHAAVVPTNVTDFEREYLHPVRSYLADLPAARLLGHSTGSLVLAHLRVEAPRVYLSPWWGIHTDGLASLLLPLVRRLPVARPVVPVAGDPEAIGDLAGPDRDDPDPIAPAYLREIHRAQRTLPPLREHSVVFCSLSDTVVDVGAIGEHAPADQVRLYDGGHEFFASSGRETVVERVADAVAELAPASL